ncbi:hypothetical protein VI08_13325 [Luteibacter yeojuensis]|uniref:NAD-dependent epimerase/dehydratase domain-containing protein n=1 Tax=Luteibacter yeojuensis TaxID=345309 RepID=A0A0F3KL07_9GAMM|nr:hypothetical protein VI08_13325 [Luteibacter yeojuensis]
MARAQPIEAVVHLAAAGVKPGDRDPATLIGANAVLPSQMAMLAHELGANAFVCTGTNAEYAPSEAEFVSETAALETIRLYGATKAAGGLLSVSTGATVGLPVVYLRLFNIFGPGEAAHRLLPSLVESLRKGDDVPLSEGSQVRDFVHVDDACRAILAALQSASLGNLASGHYNICSGEAHTVRDFAMRVALGMGVTTDRLKFGAIPMRPDDLPRVVGDPTKFLDRTGWRPALAFDEAIAQAVAELIQATGVQPNE